MTQELLKTKPYQYHVYGRKFAATALQHNSVYWTVDFAYNILFLLLSFGPQNC